MPYASRDNDRSIDSNRKRKYIYIYQERNNCVTIFKLLYFYNPKPRFNTCVYDRDGATAAATRKERERERERRRRKNYHSCFLARFSRFKAKIPAGKRNGCIGLYPCVEASSELYLITWRKSPTPVDVARANKLCLWRRRTQGNPANGKIRKRRSGEREKERKHGELYFVTSDRYRAVN